MTVFYRSFLFSVLAMFLLSLKIFYFFRIKNKISLKKIIAMPLLFIGKDIIVKDKQSLIRL